MMAFILKNISAEVHDVFLNNHPKEHFMQSSAWGTIKEMGGSWHTETLGLFDSDKLVASTLLLHRKLPIINSYIFYAPRGFIIDFNNDLFLSTFTSAIKKYVKGHHGCYLIVDPDIYFKVSNTKGEVIAEQKDFVERMLKLGYLHNGYTMNFEASQPRFTFRLKLDKTKEEIFNNYSKIIRTNMKNANNYIKCTKSDDIKTFYDILSDTAIRDEFIDSGLEYYQRVYETLKKQDMSTLYMATYYPNLHIDYILDKVGTLQIEYDKCLLKLKQVSDDEKSLNRIKQLDEQLLKLNKTLEITTKANFDYPSGIVLASGITIHTKHKAWLVYGGNRTIFRDVCANYAIKEFEINDDIDKGYEFVDFFGTIGNPQVDNVLFGIHDFKRKFGGDYIEFPGEFHLVTNKLVYKLWISVYPKAIDFLRKKEIKKRKNVE